MRQPAPPDRPIGATILALGFASFAIILREMHVISWSWKWVGVGLAGGTVLTVLLLLLGSFALPMKNGRYHPRG